MTSSPLLSRAVASHPPSSNLLRALQPLQSSIVSAISAGVFVSPLRVMRLVWHTLVYVCAFPLANLSGSARIGSVKQRLLPQILDDYAATMDARLMSRAKA